MQLYAILRRSGWTTPDELGAAAERSTAEGNAMSDDSPDKIREHAQRVGMPATDSFDVVDTVLARPDPEPAAAA
jgi:hypothetical protein